jgi:hypothetical protein
MKTLRMKKPQSRSRKPRDLEKIGTKNIFSNTNPIAGLQRIIGNQAVQQLLRDNTTVIRSAPDKFNEGARLHDLPPAASPSFQRRDGEETGDTSTTEKTPEPSITGGDSGEQAQAMDTDVACAAFESMTRAAVAICRLASEDSDKCEAACARVRAHAGGPHMLAQRCNSQIPEIGFKEQRKSGSACGTHADLGVGAFGLTISEEMVHHVDPYARCFLDDFQIRRTAQDRTHEKVNGKWRLVSDTENGNDDTPDPSGFAECMKPPYLHSYDSPGWVTFNTTRQLKAGSKLTSADATEVQLRMNFVEWVRGAGSGFVTQKNRVNWGFILHLKWVGERWKIAPDSDVFTNHVSLDP